MKRGKWYSLYLEILHTKPILHFYTLGEGLFGQQCGKEVWISLMRNNPPARNYVHECLHLIYPKMSEHDVQLWESVIWRRLTHRQRLRLYRKMFNRR